MNLLPTRINSAPSPSAAHPRDAWLLLLVLSLLLGILALDALSLPTGLVRVLQISLAAATLVWALCLPRGLVRFLRRLVLILPLLLLILGLNLLVNGFQLDVLNLLLRTLQSVSLLILLSLTLPLPRLLTLLGKWHFPGILLMLIRFVHLYAVVLQDEWRRMEMAWRFRSAETTRHILRLRTLRLLGLLLIRTFSRAERVQRALLMRMGAG